MADYSPVPINFEEANYYAALEGVKQDLFWVVKASKKYKEINISDIIEREAFTFALITKYGRANFKGKRKWISKRWIQELTSEEQESHNYFMALRKKYTAHSVNDFKENYARVVIKNISSTNPEFNQVSVSHTRVSSIGVDDVEKISELSRKLIKKIESVMKTGKIKVKKIARRIPIEDLVKHKHTKQFLSGKNNPYENRTRKIVK